MNIVDPNKIPSPSTPTTVQYRVDRSFRVVQTVQFLLNNLPVLTWYSQTPHSGERKAKHATRLHIMTRAYHPTVAK
jgi:hypothetical protein